MDRLRGEPEAKPQSYWINTSGNDLVKRFIDKANKTTRDEIERLVSGEEIEKVVRLELTYDEIDNSIENLWSVLFTTGYLTQAGMTEEGVYRLVIPNREVREVSGLEKACEKAIAQIKDRRYDEYLKNEGRNNILHYGIAFSRKRCKVVTEWFEA